MKRCRLNISVYFAVIMACIVVLDHTGLAVLALICAALHEAGHFIAIAASGGEVEEVSFKTFGINIRLSRTAKLSYSDECIISLAGCAANLVCCLAAFLLFRLGVAEDKMYAMAYMNLILCAFNIIPISSLDGGRALEAALCGRYGFVKAHNAVRITSAVFIIPLTVAGLWLLVRTGYNFSLLAASIYLTVGLIFRGRLFELA
jgi:stage IV sporulation protein FB